MHQDLPDLFLQMTTALMFVGKALWVVMQYVMFLGCAFIAPPLLFAKSVEWLERKGTSSIIKGRTVGRERWDESLTDQTLNNWEA